MDSEQESKRSTCNTYLFMSWSEYRQLVLPRWEMHPVLFTLQPPPSGGWKSRWILHAEHAQDEEMSLFGTLSNTKRKDGVPIFFKSEELNTEIQKCGRKRYTVIAYNYYFWLNCQSYKKILEFSVRMDWKTNTEFQDDGNTSCQEAQKVPFISWPHWVVRSDSAYDIQI